MKTITIIILAAFSLSLTAAFGSTDPSTTPKTLISNDVVEVIAVDHLEIFTSAEFDAETENLTFSTKDDITVIQIFDESGELQFQLPVMSDRVKINKNLFDEGTYKMGFILRGQSQLHTTQVTVK